MIPIIELVQQVQQGNRLYALLIILFIIVFYKQKQKIRTLNVCLWLLFLKKKSCYQGPVSLDCGPPLQVGCAPVTMVTLFPTQSQGHGWTILQLLPSTGGLCCSTEGQKCNILWGNSFHRLIYDKRIPRGPFCLGPFTRITNLKIVLIWTQPGGNFDHFSSGTDSTQHSLGVTLCS